MQELLNSCEKCHVKCVELLNLFSEHSIFSAGGGVTDFKQIITGEEEVCSQRIIITLVLFSIFGWESLS